MLYNVDITRRNFRSCGTPSQLLYIFAYGSIKCCLYTHQYLKPFFKIKNKMHLTTNNTFLQYMIVQNNKHRWYVRQDTHTYARILCFFFSYLEFEINGNQNISYYYWYWLQWFKTNDGKAVLGLQNKILLDRLVLSKKIGFHFSQ